MRPLRSTFAKSCVVELGRVDAEAGEHQRCGQRRAGREEIRGGQIVSAVLEVVALVVAHEFRGGAGQHRSRFHQRHGLQIRVRRRRPVQGRPGGTAPRRTRQRCRSRASLPRVLPADRSRENRRGCGSPRGARSVAAGRSAASAANAAAASSRAVNVRMGPRDEKHDTARIVIHRRFSAWNLPSRCGILPMVLRHGSRVRTRLRFAMRRCGGAGGLFHRAVSAVSTAPPQPVVAPSPAIVPSVGNEIAMRAISQLGSTVRMGRG